MTAYDFVRSEALTKALEFWRENRPASDEQVVATAEKFRAFLTGETKTYEAKPEDPRPTIKLPSVHDAYVYFQFLDTHVLYRSDVGYMAEAPGSVERINLKLNNGWESSQAKVHTRSKLRYLSEYHEISASRAAELFQRYLTGVRFE